MANPNPKPGLANLRPWKPGQSGNPSGRPKKQPYLEAMMIRANMRAPEAVIVKLNSTVPCVPCKGTGVQGTPERPIRCRHCKGSKFEALIWPDATYAEVEAC